MLIERQGGMSKNSKIKLAFLINDLLIGGAQKLILDMARRIDKESFEIVVIKLKNESQLKPGIDTFIEDFQKLKIPVLDVNGGKRFSYTEAVRLYKLLKKERPDVLHTHLPYAGILGRVIGRIARVPVIISTQHNFPRAYTPKVKFLEKLTFPLADMIVCIYDDLEEQMFGSVKMFKPELVRQKRKNSTIYNGVDLEAIDERIRDANPVALKKEFGITDEPVIAMVGRMVFWKGHRFLIGAMAEVVKKYPRAKLLLIGYGGIENDLKKQAEELGIKNNVIFAGARKDVFEILTIVDVFASPYTHEAGSGGGFGVTFIEAMAVGKAVVSTVGPGIDIAVKHEKTGLLVPPMTVEPLAKAIIELLNNPEKRTVFGRAGRELVEEVFSTKAMVKNYESLYSTLLEKKNI